MESILVVPKFIYFITGGVRELIIQLRANEKTEWV